MPYPLRVPGSRRFGRFATCRHARVAHEGFALLDRSAGTLTAGVQQPDEGPNSDAKRRRLWLPVGAVLLALIQVLEAGLLVATLGGYRVAGQAGLPAELLTYGVPGQYVIMAVISIRLMAALGLLTRHRAAWVLVMLITGASLATTLTGYLIGRPDDIRLLLEVAAAFYLNQPGVRAVFGVRERL